jgi:methylthioribose-1-phosphate isomerase
MDGIIRYLSSARPTANDLFWALSRVKQATEINFLKPGGEIKKIMLKEAKVLLKEDMHKCPFIGENGKKFLRKVTRC